MYDKMKIVTNQVSQLIAEIIEFKSFKKYKLFNYLVNGLSLPFIIIKLYGFNIKCYNITNDQMKKKNVFLLKLLS